MRSVEWCGSAETWRPSGRVPYVASVEEIVSERPATWC